MVVRGAPAIAIAAALSLAVEVETLKSAAAGNSQEAVSFLQNRLDYLVSRYLLQGAASTHTLFSAVVLTAIIKPELRSSNIVTSCWNLAVISFHQCMIVTTRIDGQTALSSSSCY